LKKKPKIFNGFYLFWFRLLGWIQNKIPDLPITNFTSDWNDGRAIGALVDGVAPGTHSLSWITSNSLVINSNLFNDRFMSWLGRLGPQGCIAKCYRSVISGWWLASYTTSKDSLSLFAICLHLLISLYFLLSSFCKLFKKIQFILFTVFISYYIAMLLCISLITSGIWKKNSWSSQKNWSILIWMSSRWWLICRNIPTPNCNQMHPFVPRPILTGILI